MDGRQYFQATFGLTLGLAHQGGIPPAPHCSNLKMASVHNGEAAGIFENFADNALFCKGSYKPLFFLKTGHNHQVLAGIMHIQYD